jgi:uncharacterized protein
MKPSAFNVRAPLENGEVFLMNTLTDAQAIVSDDVAALLDRLAAGAEDAGSAASDGGNEALEALAANGFLVGQDRSERAAVESFFAAFREDTSQLRITILTTLQCNFACDYCYQGDRDDGGGATEKMSLETAARVASWIVQQTDQVRPRQLVLTFFGGEPLLNVPAMVEIAERCSRHAAWRGIPQIVNIITNGLLLTPEVVERMKPLGLTGVKITLDGDRETHDRKRPLRGGQGTFDRIIENIRRVAPLVPVTIGGNFDMDTADRFPALLDFLKSQDFAGRVVKVSFKPVITPAAPALPAGAIPLSLSGPAAAPAARSCASAAGASTGRLAASRPGSPCDGCGLVDDTMSYLRDETARHGFPTSDGVHMGPCEVHRRHSHTVGPDGSLYACPGFTGEFALAVGHIDGRRDAGHAAAGRRLDRLAPWRQCGDCPFIPVCGGGCAVAAHAELGDMDAPSCHRRSLEAALTSLAAEAAGAQAGEVQ